MIAKGIMVVERVKAIDYISVIAQGGCLSNKTLIIGIYLNNNPVSKEDKVNAERLLLEDIVWHSNT